jgi:hypothetical protein
MGYQIRIVPEVEAWLSELRGTDPAAAELVDEAVTALRIAGESLGAPLVVPLDERQGRPDLDHAYQRQLEILTKVRRGAADVATSRKRVELQIEQLESHAGKLAEQARIARETGVEDAAAEATGMQSAVAGRLADLREQYAGLQAEEARVTAAGQRLQAKVDAFRTRKEATKAAWVAADVAVDVARAAAMIDNVIAEAGSLDAGAYADPEAGFADSAREHVVPLELSELRPGAPEQTNVRILFTVEAPSTAVLLAAGTEQDRLRAWRAEAVVDSRIRYQQWSTG